MNIHDESSLRAGDRLTLSILGMELTFRYCPPGKFVHKDVKWENKTVEIEKGFWIGETAVPWAFWNVVNGPVLTSLNADDDPDDYRMPLGGGYPAQFLKLIAYLNLEHGVPGFSYVVPNAEQWDYARRAGKADYPPCDQHPWGLCACIKSEFFCKSEIFSTDEKTRDGEVMCGYGNFDSGRMELPWGSTLTLEEQYDSWDVSLRLALVRNENSFQADAISFTIERNGKTMDVDVEELQAGDRMVVDGGAFGIGKDMAFRFCPPGEFVAGCTEEEIQETYRACGGRKNFGYGGIRPSYLEDAPDFYEIKEKREGTLPRGFWLAEQALPFSVKADSSGVKEANCKGFPVWRFNVWGWDILKVANCLSTPPTDVQWKYACRHGQEWGLENMVGEMWELCETVYFYDMYGPVEPHFRGGSMKGVPAKVLPSISLQMLNTYYWDFGPYRYSDPSWELPAPTPPIGIRLALRIRGYAPFTITR